MRHGNFTSFHGHIMSTRDSDPTYEAWKPAPQLQSFCIAHYSDPTYEAWKLYIPCPVSHRLFSIPILPMRHGNKKPGETACMHILHHSDPTYEAWKRSGARI